jgi:hypothetical protein
LTNIKKDLSKIQDLVSFYGEDFYGFVVLTANLGFSGGISTKKPTLLRLADCFNNCGDYLLYQV